MLRVISVLFIILLHTTQISVGSLTTTDLLKNYGGSLTFLISSENQLPSPVDLEHAQDTVITNSLTNSNNLIIHVHEGNFAVASKRMST